MTAPCPGSRREVLAFIALNSTEAYAPESVLFRADEANGTAQPLVRLKVDSDLAVQHWAQIFGHGPQAALEPTPVTLAGKTWVNYFSSDTWRGYRTTVEADVPIVDDDTPLDDATREQLTALAERGAQEPV